MKENDHEHLAFEAHCEKECLDKAQHPLHLLYTDRDTSRALDHFKAGYEAGLDRDGSNSASVTGYICLADKWLEAARLLNEVAILFEFNKEAQTHHEACAAIYEGVAKELSGLIEQEQI